MSKRNTQPRALGPYQLSSGKWYVVLKGAISSRSTRRSKVFDNRKKAEAYRDTFNWEAKGKSQIKISEAIGGYLDFCKDKGNKDSTRETKLHQLNSFFDEQDRLLRGLTPAYCAARYKALSSEVAGDTHRNALAEVKRFLKWAIEAGYLDKNPAADIEPTGERARGKPQLRLDAARTLFTLCETIWSTLDLPNPLPALESLEIRPPAWYHGPAQLPRYKSSLRGGVAACLTALLLGLRSSEVTKRKVSDLDDQGGLLHIEDTKSKAGERVLVVPDLLRPYLLEMAAGKGPGDSLFGRKDRRLVYHWALRLSSLAGLPRVNAHGLRGSFATIAVAQGEATGTVCRAIGHSGTQTGERHYIQPEAKVEANSKRLEESLRK